MKTQKNIDISFCLPVYNVAEFIEPCIISIFSQQSDTFSFEIICIDDCSTDNSLEILHNLKTRYSEIQVFSNKENSGVSYTRNRLVEMAQGKYIWFVDPDDMLYPDVVSKMFNEIESKNGNIIFGNFIRVNEDALFSSYSPNESKSFEVVSTNTIRFLPQDTDGKRMTSVCAGMFNKSFLTENQMQFKEGMIAQEDNLFFTKLPLKTDVAIKYNGLCYIYRQRASSVMHRKSPERALKYYKSMILFNSEYQQRFEKKEYINLETIKKRIHLSKESLVMCLALVPDTTFVKSEIKRLKKEKLYPYSFRKDALSNDGVFLRRVLMFLLPIEPIFWLLHFWNKRRYKK